MPDPSSLTVEEKIRLATGASLWETASIDGSGIGSVKVTDGPNGARGDSSSGQTSILFPAPIALAASFDLPLVTEVGRLLGVECQRKGAQVLLGPTLNLARHPLGGRNFESFGEDPHQVAQTGAAYITGIQSAGVGACAKHFVANDVEWSRLTVSSEADDTTLREAYLAPFEAAVAAGVWTVMAAYTRLNGTFCSENRWLLQGLLRDEWGFDGLVMSDWGAVHEPIERILAGLDLEMPGPPTENSDRLLEAALAEGPGGPLAAAIDAAAASVLRLVERAGRLGTAPLPPERGLNRPEERELVRRAAVAGTVLLANRGSLPLSPSVRSLAVIGPNAHPGSSQGGGSAQVSAHYRVSPLDGIRETFPDASHHPGVVTDRYLPLVDQWIGPVTSETFDNETLTGQPVGTETMAKLSVFRNGHQPGLTHPMRWSQRLTGTIDIDEPGEYTFGLTHTGQARLFVDDIPTVDSWTEPAPPGDSYFGEGTEEKQGTVPLATGEHRIVVEWNRGEGESIGGVRLGIRPPLDKDALLNRAVDAAAEADAAIVVVGLNRDWEGESHDRSTLRLPGRTEELIERVVAVNPNTVVVINAGGPVSLPWLGRAGATLMTWYPGQENGRALADVLFGRADPGGRLPVTFPAEMADSPTAGLVPGRDDVLDYAEGLMIGYRHYDRTGIKPLLPFGHGLSYARFKYGEPLLAGDRVEVEVSNPSDRVGTAVIQLYAEPTSPGPNRPVRVLAGFASASIGAGDHIKVVVPLIERALQRWDGDGFVRESGVTLRVGTSSRDFFGSILLPD